MTLSANTVFHFTNSLERLKGILTNGFYPNYCLEDWSLVMRVDYEVAIPMVCFCDIPLSQVQNHAGIYGNYVIGLRKKSWAMQNKINPVLYTYPASLSEIFLSNMMKEIIDKRQTCRVGRHVLPENYLKFIEFMKPYEGRLWRKNRYLKRTVRFYDEREWRFLPTNTMGERDYTPVVPKNFFLNIAQMKPYREILQTKRLLFEPKDVKYIIVKEESQVPKMITIVEAIYKSKSSALQDIWVLISKIISMEQIKEDF